MDRLITVYKCLYFSKTVEISQTFSYFSNNVSKHLSQLGITCLIWTSSRRVRLVARKYIPLQTWQQFFVYIFCNFNAVFYLFLTLWYFFLEKLHPWTQVPEDFMLTRLDSLIYLNFFTHLEANQNLVKTNVFEWWNYIHKVTCNQIKANETFFT